MKKETKAGRDLIKKLKRAPKRYARVLALIADADKRNNGSLEETRYIITSKTPVAQLEKCIIIEYTDGDFYSKRTTRVYRAMKKLVKDGDIIAAYCNGKFAPAYFAYEMKNAKIRPENDRGLGD